MIRNKKTKVVPGVMLSGAKASAGITARRASAILPRSGERILSMNIGSGTSWNAM